MQSSPGRFERRATLKMGLGLVSGFAAFMPGGRVLAAACLATPPQAEGPFHPIGDQVDKDADLTFVAGRDGKASGDVIYVHGTVRGTDCRPLANALVEIWQACASGRYNHPRDGSVAPLDPYFQYWGLAKTDATGRYIFKTIVPGAYGTGGGGMRTPHIHFKIRKPGVGELTTQMYFEGQALNARDGLLRNLSPEERSRVVVRFEPAPSGYEAGSKIGVFDITLG